MKNSWWLCMLYMYKYSSWRNNSFKFQSSSQILSITVFIWTIFFRVRSLTLIGMPVTFFYKRILLIDNFVNMLSIGYINVVWPRSCTWGARKRPYAVGNYTSEVENKFRITWSKSDEKCVSSEFVHDHNIEIAMVPYLPKKNKNIVLLSSSHSGCEIVSMHSKEQTSDDFELQLWKERCWPIWPEHWRV